MPAYDDDNGNNDDLVVSRSGSNNCIFLDLIIMYRLKFFNLFNQIRLLVTWKASNCILRDFSFSMFIINFKLSGFDIYRVITCNSCNIRTNSNNR
ncbi:hypothetical protein PUN28_009033 [Cardiocondyla obscurior]|uniref:Uncharacterized protein n=1 Tax=Cardiocondyla obscurior TaxID=286306 RepID=A0AAW2FVW9_9HYME